MASGTPLIDFNPEALRAVLADGFGAERHFRVERISGGQSNPTYFVDWGKAQLVLRKQPNGPIVKGAHAVDREYRVLRALFPTDVPVPEPVHYHADAQALGTPFYLMKRVAGRVLEEASMAGAARKERRDLWMAVADALAALHSVVPGDVGLDDYGKPGNYFERQISRWTRQYRASNHGAIPALDVLCEWLPEHSPPDDGLVCLAHGDFRVGNMLFHPSRPEVAAILDWELSTLGHPLADLGFCCMPWHTSPDEYGGILGLDHEALGLPDEKEFVARYSEKVPFSAMILPFHKAFALFRFAVIFVGIADRARAGNAADARAAALAPLAERFAIRALEVIAKGRGG
ncbi:phosphotransferase family protein [Roseibium sp. RKSG952]|nr:phosphotransferase family protein [Roseibium sp. RKSG952]